MAGKSQMTQGLNLFELQGQRVQLGTSASEALLLQKALDEQRERIAAGVEHAARTHLQDYDATLFDIADAIRSGEIGGEQSERGERK